MSSLNFVLKKRITFDHTVIDLSFDKKINGLYVHIKKALVLLLLQCTVHAPYRYEFREDDESTDFPSTS